MKSDKSVSVGVQGRLINMEPVGNHYPADSTIGFANVYPVDNDLHYPPDKSQSSG